MGACAQIGQGQTLTCEDSLNPGLQPVLRLLNVDDLATITFDGANKSLITDVTKTATKQAYRFVGSKDASITSALETASKKYVNVVNQSIVFPVVTKTAADKENLQALLNSKSYAIVEKLRKGTNGDNKYHWWGENGGGEVALAETDDANGDDDSGITICTWTANNQKIPATIFITDEATTDTVITTLETP